MSLFTDGIISSIEELAGYETSILDVASAEGISLTGKLALAQGEMGIELTSSFLRQGDYDAAAQLGNSSQLDHVVVTAPLRLWHIFHSLMLVYRDAYNNQLNDRYIGKWNEYKELARWASERLFQIGVGIVSDPIRQAGAPELSSVPGSQPEATYYVRIAWKNRIGEESAPGKLASISLPSGNLLRVDASDPPQNATGWNVYVGFSPASATLQNSGPLDEGQAWVMPTAGLVAGSPSGSGQAPNYLRAIPRFLLRG